MTPPDFQIFPGWTLPPNDPSRDVRPAFTVTAPPEREFDDDGPECDAGEDFGEYDEWCDACSNTGEIDCFCGGDLCVCRNGGSTPCPNCG